MSRPVCLVTGATSGLGLATAQALAARGATVVLAGRTPARASAAVEHVRAAVPGASVEWVAGDLERLASVRAMAEEVRARHPVLDVLVNNAGAMFRERRLSEDGAELTLAVNHLAPFLLTTLLLDRLDAGAPSRIVNLSSVAHRSGRLDFDDLAMDRGYGAYRAYARSKLANVLFTMELARRLDPARTTVNALHPGLVRTDIGMRNGPLRALAWRLTYARHGSDALTPEAAAASVVHLATAPELASVSGAYFSETTIEPSSPAGVDPALAARLWQVSERLTDPAAAAARAA
jgi:NAD(P)-dependent dehydrogenase (short-subunit alcohol dehydrogenase family)